MVEPTPAAAGLVARDQQHGAASRLEREGGPPLPACRCRPCRPRPAAWRGEQARTRGRSAIARLPLPALSPATSSMARRAGSNARAVRHCPPAAPNRSSFMFACRELLSVSTRSRPDCGPDCPNWRVTARVSSCTSCCTAKNSGSNSSAISTFRRVPATCWRPNMTSLTCRVPAPAGLRPCGSGRRRCLEVARGRRTLSRTPRP